VTLSMILFTLLGLCNRSDLRWLEIQPALEAILLNIRRTFIISDPVRRDPDMIGWADTHSIKQTIDFANPPEQHQPRQERLFLLDNGELFVKGSKWLIFISYEVVTLPFHNTKLL